jgi:hypothetical protein
MQGVLKKFHLTIVRVLKDPSMNYGEDLAYWYLRLNGFFPITNFVIHQSPGVDHRSDIDVLAIRAPHVFEEVGGQTHDWDEYLASSFGFGRSIGIICEVKTGAYNLDTLFRAEYVHYAIGRLGLVENADVSAVTDALIISPLVEVLGGSAIAKLFISYSDKRDGPYFARTIDQVEDFIVNRVRRYPLEKFASRMFFPLGVFQLLIAQVHRAIAARGAA